MEPCKDKFTIEALNIRYQCQLSFRRPNSYGDNRARTLLTVQYDLNVISCPHAAIIAA